MKYIAVLPILVCLGFCVQGAESLAANKVTVGKGTIVSELGKSVMYAYQAKNNHYWFGRNDRGVFRYDGKTLVNFTTNDGLVSNRIWGIQGDKHGNIYFTTYEGISQFNGQEFKTLTVSENSKADDWKLRPDELWSVGPPNADVVFRKTPHTTLHVGLGFSFLQTAKSARRAAVGRRRSLRGPSCNAGA